MKLVRVIIRAVWYTWLMGCIPVMVVSYFKSVAYSADALDYLWLFPLSALILGICILSSVLIEWLCYSFTSKKKRKRG